jgi:hypothetical protein
MLYILANISIHQKLKSYKTSKQKGLSLIKFRKVSNENFHKPIDKDGKMYGI